jgi:uncharacterized protein (DUF58 family)
MRRALAGLGRVLWRNQNLLLALALFGALVGLAMVSGYWLFYRAAYLVGGLILVSLIWAIVNARGLDVSVERTSPRVQVGQRSEARVNLHNRTFYTKLWLEVEDLTDAPSGPARTVTALSARGQRDWKPSVLCTRRGAFSMGPVRVTTGDPFGLFRFGRSYGPRHRLLVLPRSEELADFWIPSAQLPGEGTAYRLIHYVSPNAATVREYQPGDSYNCIHWRSTARLNRLMVKKFEMHPDSEVWLLLDLQSAVQVGAGDDSTQEYGVRVAASLANHLLQANRMVGLIAYGEETVVIDAARGPEQHMRVLEALALARAEGEEPLSGVLQQEVRRFGRHSTVVVITPSTDEGWVAALQPMVQRGGRAAAVILEPGSFGASESALAPLSILVASGIPNVIVRCGDDLSLALGPGGASTRHFWGRRGAKVR